MTSTKFVKQRIKSVKNTAQITKAMEVVSATKMRRSQEFALMARPYAQASLELLNNLLIRTPALPDLLQQRTVTRTCYLVITSDKGLAGAFQILVPGGRIVVISFHSLEDRIVKAFVRSLDQKATHERVLVHRNRKIHKFERSATLRVITKI